MCAAWRMKLCLTIPWERDIIIPVHAGVLELADEADSKSVGLITRAGSTPATGIKNALVFGKCIFYAMK